MIFKRPWLILFQFVISLIFTAAALMQVWHGVQLWDFLDQLQMTVSPLYLVIAGCVWGIVGGWAAIRVWWGRPGTPAFLIIVALIYTSFTWFEQIFLMINPLRKVSWPFLAVLNLAVVLVIFLSFRHPAVRNFYGGSRE